MSRNANAPGHGGGACETVTDGRLSHADHSPPAPSAASRLTFTPDANERNCPRCCRLVIRRDHQRRCPARVRGAP
jgi:hypothetical protein